MKRFLTLLLSFILAAAGACLSACENGTNGNNNGGSPKDGEDPKQSVDFLKDNPLVDFSDGGYETSLYEWGNTDGYDIKTGMIPIWQTRNVYFETVTFIGKNDLKAKLFYTPTRILSVYNYALNTEYTEGVDYTVSGRTITLTQDTRINFWSVFDYFSGNTGPYGIWHINGEDKIYFSETVPGEHQIAVCYEHEDKWNGPIPKGQSDRLEKTISALKAGETVNIGMIGDSITEGCGSTKYNKVSPNGSCYAELIRDYLAAKYPQATVTLNNKAKGGMGSAWGASTEADTGMGRFIGADPVPDLFIIAWGMNDTTTDLAVFKERMESIIRTAKTINPNCEIVFVSSMIPNAEAVIPNSTQTYTGVVPQLEDKLIELYNGDMAADTKAALGDTEIAVAPMTAFSRYLYTTGKRFSDIGGNNVNHPNDFLHRIQAQVVLKTILGNDFTVLD